MPYTLPSQDELMKRINARLGIVEGARAPDDPLAGPIRMKGPSELPGYTQETPGQESARITGEYNRAGSNARTAYGEVSEFVTSIPMGAATGLATLGSTVIDPAAAYMGYGTPITNRLVQNNRLLQEGGEGGVDSFVRNVVSSVVSNTAAAVGGTLVGGPVGGAIAVGTVNAVPTAMQQYQIGREEGLTDIQAKSRAAAYGVVAGTVSTVVEKFLPGTTSAIANSFAQNVAKDIAPGLTRAIFSRLARTSVSEGAEESVQEIANQFIDAATTEITGNKNLEKPYASFTDRLADIGQAFAMGAAAGGLIQGGVELVNTRRAIQEIGQQPVQQQPQAPVAPVAPTPVQPETPVAPVAPELAPVAPAQQQPDLLPEVKKQSRKDVVVPNFDPVTPAQQPIPADSGTTQPQPVEPVTPNVAAVEEQPVAEAPAPQAEITAPPAEPATEAPTPLKQRSSREVLSTLTPQAVREIAAIKGSGLYEVAKILGVEVGDMSYRAINHKGVMAAARNVLKERAISTATAATDASRVDQDVIVQSRAFLELLSPEIRKEIAELKTGRVEDLASVLGIDREVFKEMGFLSQARTRAILVREARQAEKDAAKQPAAPEQALDDAPKEMKVAAATTRAFLTEITPDQKQAIAAMKTPSRSAFAKILGVEPNQLPDVVQSENGRKAAKALAVYDSQNPDVEEARVGGRGTVMPRREGEEVPRVNQRNPKLKSFEELNRNDPRWAGTTPSSRTSPETNPPEPSYPTPTPRPIPLDAPPVTETYEQGGAEILNPSGAGDVMAQRVPAGKVTDVRMASNPDAEEASVVEISDSLGRLTEKLTGSKTPRGEGGFKQGQGEGSLEGYHRRSNKSIRMKSWSDMPTAAHELAHSIWNYSNILGWKKGDPRRNRIQSEFRQLGEQMYPDGEASLQLKEGFSEAVRLLVQEGDAKTAQKAPVFTKWFKERLAEKNPEALAELENAQRLANTFWRDMGSQQRAASQQRGVSGVIARSIEALREARMSAVDWVWSSRQVFADIDLRIEQARGMKTAVGERLMDAVRVFSGGTALAKYWFDTNQTDAFMGIVGPSMKKILSALSLGEQEAKFWTYMYARRTIAVADPASLAAVNVYRQWMGMDPINPRETGLSVSDARQIMAEVESGSDWATIQQVAKEFDQFNKNTLKYMVQAAPGVFTSQAIDIEAVDPGAWIPLRRDITLSDFAFRQEGRRTGTGQNVGWKFRGSGMPIKNILASVLMETERRIESSNKQAIIESMLNLVVDRDGSRPMNGLGEYIQVLDSPTRDTFEFKRDGKSVHVLLNTRVQRAIGAMNQTDRDALNVVMRMVYGGLRTTTQMVTLFRLALNPTYMFLNRPLGNFIDAVFKTPASMGATGYKETAEIGATSIKRFFSISAESFAQATFDKTISKESAKFLDFVGRAAMQYNVGIRGDELQAARIGRVLGRSAMRDEKDMVGWLDSHIDWLNNVGRKASDIAESTFVADQAVAAAAYLDANPEVRAKLDRGESLSMAEISAMKETITDVTGDAADDPLIGKALNRVGMFLPSVGVRYTKSGIRAFKKNPAVILKLGLPLAALALLKELWKLHEDEDYRKWAQQNPNQAVRYTVTEVNGKQVMVPNYTELGLTFVGLPRAIAIAMYTADPAAAGAWATSVIGNLMPTGEIPALSLAWQQGTGVDRFGKPIVSEYSEKPKGYAEASSPRDRIAEEQYSDRTNPVAKAIAQTPGAILGREQLDSVERYVRKMPVVGAVVAGTMNMMRSPMRVEHLMNFVTAGTTSKINDIVQGRTNVLGMVARMEDKGTMSRPGEAGTEFYATLDRLKKRDADKREPLSKEDADALRLLNAANEAISAQRRLRSRAPDRNGEKAVASAMSLVADNAMNDLKAGKFETSRYKAVKRFADVELARIDGEETEANRLIYNGLSGFRPRPPKASQGKTMSETAAAWQEDRDESVAFREALGIPKNELLRIADTHLRAAKKSADEIARNRARLATHLK
jgi:hypothetical protein